MPCYHPIPAFQDANGLVVFAERGNIVRTFSIACGQCVGCRLERSRQWAVRCMHEASQHERNSFVTLTYDTAHVPVGYSLHYPDFQAFMKRLRKRLGKARFYMCGEYGETFGRPHYHACIFGVDFQDKVYLSKSPGGSKLYRSPTLEQLWPFGFTSIGAVNFESAAYVARYVMKKVTGRPADEHYRFTDPDTGECFDRVPEFNRCSLRPGIGSTWLRRFHSDCYPEGMVVVRGVKTKPPRYYDKWYEKFDPEGHEALLYARHVEAMARHQDNTYERLAVREQVAGAKVSLLKRSIT